MPKIDHFIILFVNMWNKICVCLPIITQVGQEQALQHTQLAAVPMIQLPGSSNEDEFCFVFECLKGLKYSFSLPSDPWMCGTYSGKRVSTSRTDSGFLTSLGKAFGMPFHLV